MILLDYSQISISNLMMQLAMSDNTQIDENLVRHMVLNSLRLYRKKFGEKYGELVICCDDSNVWRRDVFPQYKANRKKDRESSSHDWDAIFETLHTIRREIKEFLPYKVIKVHRAEADDIIATLTHAHGEFEPNKGEKILILSGDKDFGQLQKYANVSQYSPVQKKEIRIDDAKRFLREHIILGDRGDGVPNFLSDDDTFVANKRNRPISRRKVEEWSKLEPEQYCNEAMLRGYRRNEAVVSLDKIPDYVMENIIQAYNTATVAPRSGLLNYFIQKRLKNLMDSIGEF